MAAYVSTTSVTAHAATIAATTVTGTIVHFEPDVFVDFIRRIDRPLLVHNHTAGGWIFPEWHQYLIGHEGLAFYTRSKQPLDLPRDAEVVAAKAMSVNV